MKSASIPSLRIDPELRHAVEGVLRDGETLSAFAEQSIRAQIDFRRARQGFIARGLAAGAESREAREYWSADEMLTELDAVLGQAEVGKKPGK